jgi:hypothetical protein
MDIPRIVSSPGKVAVGIAAAFAFLGASAAVSLGADAPASHSARMTPVARRGFVTHKRPSLRVHRYTLTWSKVTGAPEYVVQTMLRHSHASNRHIRGNRFTPPLHPGQTVRYRVRASRRGARWSRLVSIRYGRVTQTTRMNATNVAPVLRVSGGTISWSAQPGATDFAGAVNTAPGSAPGRTSTYQDLGNATSWTPQPQCGQTLYYGVASNGSAGEQWAGREIPITWPACPQSNTKLIVGVEGTVGTDSYQPNTASDILDAGVSWDRGATDNAAARSLGFSNLVVPQSGPDGNCTGDSVSQVVALARAQIASMEAAGQHLMELCNEAYITVSAQTYAQWYDAVHKALAGTGITLGANAIWPSACSSAYNSGGCDWIGQVIAEIARLNGVPTATAAKEVDAWTIHPYAWPVSRYAYYIKTAHDQAVADGSDAPWWVTETGACLSTCWMSNGTRTEQDQADELTAELNDLVEPTADPGTPFSWVKVWIWYSVIDQSDGQWGLMAHTCPAKCTITGLRPSYYALKAWMQTHAGQTDG